MESTYRLLDNQIKAHLKGVNTYETIEYNLNLSQILDQYDISEDAKLACLTIDTAMRHLDSITNRNLSRNAILVGDLLSAHFYTLLAELNEPEYQQQISTAIVRINELKSAIHHDTLSNEELAKAILTIETAFPSITLSYFASNVDLEELNNKILNNLKDNCPSYLLKFKHEELNSILEDIETRHI
ncbi:heptaprenyl diphosphate synthase component 1 [Staphylococcus sp. SQ8-PEA]|uniref:Heptaprenyl diphosphate synthase component 1 n=1 Tax=Staphylococcus marylandisciuri TaxID=2981529 RepID=A0ABT2QNC6_9STAP|nr:heptaprenyl diphosphate synthase component 1 [Staphylococcus marylandisciuri]